MSLVELGRYLTRVEADLDRLFLQSEGLETILFDTEANSFFGGAGLMPVRLMVLAEDREAAIQLLREGAPPDQG